MILMRSLKEDALRACKNRSHHMEKFKTLAFDDRGNPKNCVSKCKDCGMEVQVLTNPAPNEIRIGGEAVSLNCKRSR
jgi:hypothetical protein